MRHSSTRASAAPAPADGAIAPIHFQNPRLNALGVEVISLQHIRQHAPDTLQAPQRVAFHLLWLVTQGTGEHTVDFKRHAVAPGLLVAVRPGQVQQWHVHDGLQGELLLVKPEALAPAAGLASPDGSRLGLNRWAPTLQTDAPLHERLAGDLMRLRADIRAFDGQDAQAAIVWHGLMATLLRVAQAMQARHPSSTHAAAAAFALFEQLLDEQGAQRQPVSAYARRLGYAESTLNRACLALAGKTTKRLVDERTALEAKRLLVHSTASVSAIGHRLGFGETTNFVKFFQRMAATTPQAFRQSVRQPQSVILPPHDVA